jgi:integrase
VDGFVFPAETQSGHIMGSSLRKQIVSAFAAINEHAKKHHEKPVAPFVLYALRHTFLTRLGASGCSAWTLATIAGHSSIVMSQRYVHTDQETVLKAMAAHQLPTTVGSPHKSPHSGEKQVSQKGAGRLLTQ